MRIWPTTVVLAMAAILLTEALVAGPAAARHGFVRSYPRWSGVCSVLSRHPCTPTVCSVFQRGPCIPEIEYPIGQELRLVIVSTAPEIKSKGAVAKPSSDPKNGTGHNLKTIRDIFSALRACWTPPPKVNAYPDMQMSVRFSFNSSGEIIDAPRVTYKSPDTPQETIDIYHDAIMAALGRCTPMPFSRGLGAAVAGRPIAIRFVDNRKQE